MSSQKNIFMWFIIPVYNIIPLESGEFYHGFDWCGEECICLGTLSLMNCVFKINTFLWICCFCYSEGSNIFYRHFPLHCVVCARLSDPLIENVNTLKGSTCSLSNKMNKLIIIQDNWIVWYEMDAKSHTKNSLVLMTMVWKWKLSHTFSQKRAITEIVGCSEGRKAHV